MIRRAFAPLILTAIMVVIGLFGAAPAQAGDVGGDGDARTCANAYTVASTPLVGSRGPTKGKVIGQLELRWSWACHANWSRVVLYGKMYTSPVTIVQDVKAEGRSASSDDHQLQTGSAGTSAWTRYLRLANSQSTACVSTSVSSDFGTLNYHTVGARLCV
ncbi:hypothetical protein CH263_08350 [Rhodococcus sp. 06-1059B-a]|nr:hypothetical protein [Rhodococcus sp. 06-1059B-a]OZD68900.1 hypothetical protein CH263_08350 [Rhodococcus sp. 06-1059B-a]